MKKLLIITALLVALVLTFASCTSSTPSDSNTPTNKQEQTTENTTDNVSENTTDNNQSTENDTTPPVSTEAPVQVSKFQQFEQGLTDKGIKFEKNDKAAAMVGAKEGYGYAFGDETSVEIYLFDKATDSYKEASKNNKLTLEGFGITFDVIFNDDVCIYFNGEPQNKADIQTIFENLK